MFFARSVFYFQVHGLELAGDIKREALLVLAGIDLSDDFSLCVVVPDRFVAIALFAQSIAFLLIRWPVRPFSVQKEVSCLAQRFGAECVLIDEQGTGAVIVASQRATAVVSGGFR